MSGIMNADLPINTRMYPAISKINVLKYLLSSLAFLLQPLPVPSQSVDLAIIQSFQSLS